MCRLGQGLGLGPGPLLGPGPGPSYSLPKYRAVEVVMTYLLKKRRSALPVPKKKGRMTMEAFLPSSVKSCEGGHGLCHHLLEKGGSAQAWAQGLNKF